MATSGNEIGPFRAVEESTLAHLTPREVRADIFAWYMLVGTGGAALGLLSCGWAISLLKKLPGYTDIDAYRIIFFAYAAFGAIKLLLTLALSSKIEADLKPERAAESEMEVFLADETAARPEPERRKTNIISRLLPHISRDSRSILVQLCLLFALDSFASGLASLLVSQRVLWLRSINVLAQIMDYILV